MTGMNQAPDAHGQASALKREADRVQERVMAAFGQQRYAQALQECEQHWLSLDPQAPQALALAGIACYLLGRHEAALAYQQRLLALPGTAPGLQADTQTNQALTLTALHRLPEAEQAYREALRLNPSQPKAWNNLGNLLARRPQDLPQALECYARALELQPAYPSAWTNLGFAREQRRDWSGAEQAYRQALAHDAQHLPALLNAADLLERQGHARQALDLYRRAVALAPDNLKAVGHAVALRRTLADWDPRQSPSVADVVRLLQRPHRQQVAPLHLMAWPEMTPALLKTAAQAFARARWAAELSAAPLCSGPAQPLTGRRLRLGYLSPDLRNHPVAHLVTGVVKAHDRKRVEVFLYAYGVPVEDGCRAALRAAADHFVELSALDDAAAAARIHADGIDVLIDLAGYTTHARLGITALRPAPLIVSWIGYVGTLGEPRLADCIVSDAVVAPPGSEADFSERQLRLSPCFQPNAAWQPVPICSSRAQEGLPEDAVVLCSFNQVFKFTPQIWDAWCEILRAAPNTVLWVPQPRHAEAAENLRLETQRRGVDPQRLVLAARVPLDQHWGRIGLADLALDTFPYNSGTSASDVLRCGVPLLTCMGQTFASRMAGSLLQTLALPSLVTHSLQDYVRQAIALAQDGQHRQTLRQQLAHTLPQSALFRPEHTARQLEEALWRLAEEGHTAPV